MLIQRELELNGQMKKKNKQKLPWRSLTLLAIYVTAETNNKLPYKYLFGLLKQLFYVIQYNFEDADCYCVFRSLDRRIFTQQTFLFLCQIISVADFMLGKYTSPDTYFSQNWSLKTNELFFFVVHRNVFLGQLLSLLWHLSFLFQ